MHLIWENTIKNLILFWTGKFKDISHNGKGYRLALHIWEQIGKDTAATAATIPSSFGAPVPNLAQEGVTLTAEMYSNWTIFIAPIVLKNRFPQPKYYDHFMKLVDAIKLCLSLEMTSETIAKIRERFRVWVEDYEKYYYEKKKDRLSACPLTIHALLHIADGIEACGPVWAYWAYPMERHCNTLLPAIRSRRHPYASITTFVTAVAQLNQIRLIYDVEGDLNLNPFKLKQYVSFPGCMLYCFLIAFADENFKLTSPQVLKELLAPHQTLIWGHLGTRFGVTTSVAKSLFALTGDFYQHGRAVIKDEDIIHGRDLKETQEDTRDASFVRYDVEIDLDARHVHPPERMAMRTFFGQLKCIVVINLPATPFVNLTEPSTVVLAIILQTPTDKIGEAFTYRNSTVEEVVDLDRVQCVVGRVCCREVWTYVDRSTQVNPPCV
ncbi:hypothetical protein BJ165DRAFT_1356338 [Panaeolus papilionaceus]|nr:hypothetical protein BJ165DRAFT_1356338 [Panaeolus papilionaceus]